MDPLEIIPGPAGTQPGNIQGADLHNAVAAGLPPIITVGFPSINAKGNAGCGACPPHKDPIPHLPQARLDPAMQKADVLLGDPV